MSARTVSVDSNNLDCMCQITSFLTIKIKSSSVCLFVTVVRIVLEDKSSMERSVSSDIFSKDCGVSTKHVSKESSVSMKMPIRKVWEVRQCQSGKFSQYEHVSKDFS
jgi:hypothetical protein